MRTLAKVIVLGLAAVTLLVTSTAAQTATGASVVLGEDQSWYWLDGSFSSNMAAIASGPGSAANAYVVASPPGPWLVQNPSVGTAWISRTANPNYTALTTTFFTYFTAGGVFPVVGEFSSDNTGNVFVNGQMAGANSGTGTFGSWWDFAETTQVGTNYIALEVVNWDTSPLPHGGILYANTVAVPEPASLALLGTGLLGLMGVAYRRRREV